MNPLGYVRKYNLVEKGWKPKYKDKFIGDMKKEFELTLQNLSIKGNLKAFQNAINIIRSKWDGISNKIPYGLPEDLWKYFYATIIIPFKNELCSEELNRKRSKSNHK